MSPRVSLPQSLFQLADTGLGGAAGLLGLRMGAFGGAAGLLGLQVGVFGGVAGLLGLQVGLFGLQVGLAFGLKGGDVSARRGVVPSQLPCSQRMS